MVTEDGEKGRQKEPFSLVPADVPVFEGEASSGSYPLADIIPVDGIRRRIDDRTTKEAP